MGILGVFIVGLVFHLIQKRRIQNLTEKLKQQSIQIELEKKATEAEKYAKEREIQLNLAASSFVPHAFLNHLEKVSIMDIRAGDHVEKNVIVLFSDIRSYTKISENLKTTEIFELLNNYLSYAVNSIMKYGGFIDKFIGDAIMGVFTGIADDALLAVIDLKNSLKEYNRKRIDMNYQELKIGVGLHLGFVTLGTIGTEKRMDTTLIGDAVNLASRLESATKVYQIDILISDSLYNNLQNPESFHIREIDTVRVKGKLTPIILYEVFDNDDEAVKEKKMKSLKILKQGIENYKKGDFSEAIEQFKKCQEICPEDNLPQIYIKRCSTLIRIVPGPDWAGISGL